VFFRCSHKNRDNWRAGEAPGCRAGWTERETAQSRGWESTQECRTVSKCRRSKGCYFIILCLENSQFEYSEI